MVTVAWAGRTSTYQIPLTFRWDPVPELADAQVGAVREGGRTVHVYDAPYDPAFVTTWLTLVMDQSPGAPTGSGHPVRVSGRRQPGTGPGRVDRPCRVLGTEQSNTSIVIEAERDPDPLIVKVFRVLGSGPNPDVSVTSALTEAGCPHVPRLVGWWDGQWTDPAGDRVDGHLASVSEFFTGSTDAWQEACVAVERGRSFRDEARGIGAATAWVHADLARNLPTEPPDERAVRDLVERLTRRLRWAVEAVPDLVEFADAAEMMIDSVGRLTDLPRLQRIHGDLHLGQVLGTRQRGWILLDFEGEPLRPLAERSRPDLIHRDLAGMVRSFDYAASRILLDHPGDESQRERIVTWVDQARESFLAGYREAGGEDRAPGLLPVLELDKALYEVVYESRNRPAWTPIPRSAVRRLCTGVGVG
jgi:trehalose synthase-fused probable maltokinase